LNNTRATLIRQLAQPEYETVKQVIGGELKAVDAILTQYIQMFRLDEEHEAIGRNKADTGKDNSIDNSAENNTENGGE